MNQIDYRLHVIEAREYSDWECQLFGSNGGLSWRPYKGEEPNWFWRKMQYLVFGNKWVKDVKRIAADASQKENTPKT